MKNQKSQNQTSCPYLGLISDSRTSTMFPSLGNACQLVNPPAPVILDYQSSCCLSQSHVDCPGYVRGWPDGFPKNLRGHQPAKQKVSPPKWALFLGIGVLLIALVIGAFLQISRPGDGPIATIEGGMQIFTATGTKAPTATPTLAPTTTNTIKPSPTVTNTPSATFTQTPGPGLTTPFGSDGLTFVVHEVLAGETMEGIAEKYDINPSVLDAINQFIPPERTTLWEGDMLVICLGCEDPGELPKLQAIYLESAEPLEELAKTYNTHTEEIRRWNDLGEGDRIEKPRWVIVRVN